MIRRRGILIIFLCGIFVTQGSKEDICSLDPDSGSCSVYTQKFFFNPYTGDCHQFIYGGCLGNKNQFETRKECEEYCQGMHLDKKQDCHKKSDRGPCDGYMVRYYYDSSEGDCKTFMYGGCKGNTNNFRSWRQCMDTCEEGKSKYL